MAFPDQQKGPFPKKSPSKYYPSYVGAYGSFLDSDYYYVFEDKDKGKEQHPPTPNQVSSIKSLKRQYRNDYCLNFLETGKRPENYIRNISLSERFMDYPKLNELIRRKDEVVEKRATPPMALQCDLKTYDLASLGKFDVILIDPPWEEYKRRVTNYPYKIGKYNLEPWTYEEISNLRVDLISDNPSFIFFWVGTCEGVDIGRQIMKKWGFRRCEDIVWLKTNIKPTTQCYYDTSFSILKHTKEHCLVGIKGTVRRGQDIHFINANIDTDVIVSEEPPIGSTEKPDELYRIIERFCLGRKRIELFGEDHNIHPGWLTLGNCISKSNFDKEEYDNSFKGDGMFPQIQDCNGGRYIGTTPEIEALRPRSPTRMMPIQPFLPLKFHIMTLEGPTKKVKTEEE